MKTRRSPMRGVRLLMAVVAASSASIAFAEADDAEQGQIISLTPQQKQEALESGGGRVRSQPLSSLPGDGPSRQIHGEIGAMVGTGGARGVYGTAAVPLGDNAGAILSFEKSRYGRGSGWIPACHDPRCRMGMGVIDPFR